jgi:Zn finger protein HypA/HybF involved in hydrogenase expression
MAKYKPFKEEGFLPIDVKRIEIGSMNFRCEHCGAPNEVKLSETLECRCATCGVQPSFLAIAKNAESVRVNYEEPKTIIVWGELFTYLF